MKMWISRDSGGALFLHLEKPIKIATYGYFDSENRFNIDRDLFPEVTFENSPMEVELKLKKENGSNR